MSVAIQPISLSALAIQNGGWFELNTTAVKPGWTSQAATLRGSLPTLGQPSGIFINMVAPASFFNLINLPSSQAFPQQAIEFTFELNRRTYVIISDKFLCLYDSGPPASFKISIWGEARLVSPPLI